MQRGRGARSRGSTTRGGRGGNAPTTAPAQRGGGWSKVFGQRTGALSAVGSANSTHDSNNSTGLAYDKSVGELDERVAAMTINNTDNNNNNNNNNKKDTDNNDNENDNLTKPKTFAYVPKVQQQEKRQQKEKTFQSYHEGQIREVSAKMPGFTVEEQFITEEEEKKIVEWLDAQTWETELARRVQQYGYRFYYCWKYTLIRDEPPTPRMPPPIPDILHEVGKRLLAQGHFHELPDAIIVNEYFPGQGINPHVDKPCFEEAVASVSMMSSVVMEFRHTKAFDKLSLLLQPQSLFVLKDEARYKWTHGIARDDTQVYGPYTINRARRISLTFRNVKKSLLRSHERQQKPGGS